MSFVQKNKLDLRLYAITDRSWLKGKTLEQQVQEAIDGGITILQLREKNVSFSEYVESAIRIKKITEIAGIPLIINDNVEVVMTSNADGVHLGQGDMSASDARKILGSEKIIGATAKTVEQAIKAEQDGANYLGVGAVFPTSTKKDAIGISFEQLEKICERVSIPVVAIGGITSQNILKLKGSNIAGVAIVSGIFSSNNIKASVKELLELCGKVVDN